MVDNFLPSYVPQTAKVQVVEELSRRVIALQLLKDNLVKTSDRMKKYADMHRSERSFNVGDYVYFSLQLYRQLSVGAQN